MDYLAPPKRIADPLYGQFFQQNDLRVRTRTNRLFGFWVADLLGLSPESAAQYVESLLLIDLKVGGHDLLEKVHHDLSDANILMSEDLLQDQVDQFCRIVKADLTEH